MYYVLEIDQSKRGFVRPFVVVFEPNGMRVDVYAKYTKHPDFGAMKVEPTRINLPQLAIDSNSYAKYIVVKASKGAAVYLGDDMAPGLVMEFKAYATLPKAYAVPAWMTATPAAGTAGTATQQQAVTV